MSVDTSNAFIVGGTSAVIGFGIAYFAYKKFISDRYGKGKKKQNSIFFWCGLIAMIAVGQGTGTILNQLISSAVSNTKINDDAIARGIITIFLYPALLAVVAFVLGLIFKKSSTNIVASETNKPAVVEHVSAASTATIRYKKAILASVFFAALAGGCYFMFGQEYFAKQWRFDVVECEVCEWKFETQKTECSTKTGLKHFTVYEDKVISFIKRSDGQTSVFQSPDEDGKCFFNVDGKFSFNCRSVSNSGNQLFENYKEFDGKENYKSKFIWHITMNNDVRKVEESNSTCKVKG